MIRTGMGIWILAACLACAENEVPFLQASGVVLSAPRVTVDSILFQEQAVIRAMHPEDGAVLHYSLEGTEVTEEQDIYTGPILAGTSQDILFKAFHPDFIASETVPVSVKKVAGRCAVLPATSTRPQDPYVASGLQSIVDLSKGDAQFSVDHRWLGYQQKAVRFDLAIDPGTQYNTLTVSTLCNHGSWIFNPLRIEVLAEGELIGSLDIPPPDSATAPSQHFWDIPVDHVETRILTVSIQCLLVLPEWHAGAGSAPWLFVDEIFVQ